MMTTLSWHSFIHLWACKDPAHKDVPGGCWADSHLSLRDIQDQVAKWCAPMCRCWRHTIINYVTNNGTWSPEE